MDYRALLKRYMRAVIEAESVSFASGVPDAADRAKLDAIEAELRSEIEAEQPAPPTA